MHFDGRGINIIKKRDRRETTIIKILFENQTAQTQIGDKIQILKGVRKDVYYLRFFSILIQIPFFKKLPKMGTGATRSRAHSQ